MASVATEWRTEIGWPVSRFAPERAMGTSTQPSIPDQKVVMAILPRTWPASS